MLEQFIDSALMYNLTLTLFHFLWQGVLVALFLKCALVIVPWKNAQGRYLASAFAMVANLALPIFTFFYINQYSSGSNAEIANIQGLEVVSNGLVGTGPTAFTNNLVEYSTYIGIFWLATVLFLASKIFIELYSVNQLPKKGNLPVNELLMSRFGELVERIGLKRMPRLLVSVRVQVPMAIGWLKPVVLIPASMVTGLTPAQLDMLLLHELAHIRRHDYLVNFLQTLVEILLFFHPCVYWISKQMRNEREYCSDDIAVHHCGDPIAYAHTLADTASLCKKHRHMPIPNIAMAASGGDLKQRVVRLVDHHCTANSHSAKWLASIAAISTIMLLSTKQFITAPIIDLSSGHFSLSAFKGPQKSSNYSPNTTPLAESSLAQQLLTQESPTTVKASSSGITHGEAYKNDEPIALDKELQLGTALKSNSSSSDTTDIAFNELDELQLTKNQQRKIRPADTFQINDTNAGIGAVKKMSTATEISNVSAQKIESAMVIDSLINNSDKQLDRLTAKNQAATKETTSSARAAFAKTDSTNVNSLMASPYAAQISALEHSPLASEVNFDSLLNEKTGFRKSDALSIYSMQGKSSVVETAHALHSVEPKYPSMAKRKGIELDVTVHFTIDKQGNVRDIEFERKNKVNYFRTSIRNAMNKWRFQPALKNGKPVESKLSKIFSFSLLK